QRIPEWCGAWDAAARAQSSAPSSASPPRRWRATAGWATSPCRAAPALRTHRAIGRRSGRRPLPPRAALSPAPESFPVLGLQLLVRAPQELEVEHLGRRDLPLDLQRLAGAGDDVPHLLVAEGAVAGPDRHDEIVHLVLVRRVLRLQEAHQDRHCRGLA